MNKLEVLQDITNSDLDNIFSGSSEQTAEDPFSGIVPETAPPSRMRSTLIETGAIFIAGLTTSALLAETISQRVNSEAALAIIVIAGGLSGLAALRKLMSGVAQDTDEQRNFWIRTRSQHNRDYDANYQVVQQSQLALPAQTQPSIDSK